MYDKTCSKEDFNGHGTFNVNAEPTLGFSDQDFHDSKASFRLFERFRKSYLNPVVVLKRLPKAERHGVDSLQRMGYGTKRRHPRPNLGDKLSSSDCRRVQYSSLKIGQSLIQTPEGETEKASGETVSLAQTTISYSHEQPAKSIPRLSNNLVHHSSVGSLEETCGYPADWACSKPISSQQTDGKISDMEAGIPDRTDIQSFVEFVESQSPLARDSEGHDGTAATPAIPTKTIHEQGKINPVRNVRKHRAKLWSRQTKKNQPINSKRSRNSSLSLDELTLTEKFIEHEKFECNRSTTLDTNFDFESQYAESVKNYAELPHEEGFENNNTCHVANSPMPKTKPDSNPEKGRTTLLQRETSCPSKSLPSVNSADTKNGNTININQGKSFPPFQKMWTMLRPCVVKLERAHALDELVLKHSKNSLGLTLVRQYRNRRNKSSRAVSPEPSSKDRLTLLRQSSDRKVLDDALAACSTEGTAVAHENVASMFREDSQEKIDLSDAATLKKLCQLQSIPIEDSDSEQGVDEAQVKLPTQRNHTTTSPETTLPASHNPVLCDTAGSMGSVEGLHESDLHESFHLDDERLFDSMWSDVLNLGKPEDSEIENISDSPKKLSDPLPIMSQDCGLTERLNEVKSVNQKIGLDVSKVSAECVKQLYQDGLDVSPATEVKPSNNSHCASSNASKTPRKIRLKIARKRGKASGKADISYVYSCSGKSEPVHLPEYKELTRRPFKRQKVSKKSVSDTSTISELKPTAKNDDLCTPNIKKEKSDQYDNAVNGGSAGEMIDVKAETESTKNIFRELSTIPYIMKCNLQNRSRKCKNLSPCANANKKFKLFFSLSLGTGRSLSQPLLDTLRNQEDPSVINRISANIAASAVLSQPCTILIPAAPEVMTKLLPPRLLNSLMETVTETNRMDNKVKKSIQASAIAEALQVKRAIIAKKSKVSSSPVKEDIQPLVINNVVPEPEDMPHESSQCDATKSKIDNKIRFIRRLRPILAKGSKEHADAGISGNTDDNAGSEAHVDRTEAVSNNEKSSEDLEGEGSFGLSSDISEINYSDSRSSLDESRPTCDANLSLETSAIDRVALQPENGASFPIEGHTLSSVDSEGGSLNESVGNDSGLGENGPNGGIGSCLPNRLSNERADSGSDENDSVPGMSCIGMGLSNDGLLETSSSSALVNCDESEIHAQGDPVPSENLIVESPVSSSELFDDRNESSTEFSKDCKNPKVSPESTGLPLSQDNGDLTIPFDMMDDPTFSFEPNSYVLPDNGPGDWLLTPPHSQAPDALSSQNSHTPSPQLTNYEVPDVILVPNKVESIDLTSCEEENHSIFSDADIDPTSISTYGMSEDGLPEWGVICSTLPELGYVKVLKVGSRLVIHDESVVPEPLGFKNVHSMNRFLNKRLADLSYSYQKKIVMEWIVVTHGYLKVKTIPPTNPQFWQNPSTAVDTLKTINSCNNRKRKAPVKTTTNVEQSASKRSMKSPVVTIPSVSVKSNQVNTASVAQPVSEGPKSGSVSSENPMLTLVCDPKTSSVPHTRPSVSSKPVASTLTKAASTSAAPLLSMALKSNNRPTHFRQIVVTPGSVEFTSSFKDYVTTYSTVGKSVASLIKKSTGSTTTTFTQLAPKLASSIVRPTLVGTPTGAGYGTAIVVGKDVKNLQSLQTSASRPGISLLKPNHRPILILRKGVSVRSSPTPTKAIETLLNRK